MNQIVYVATVKDFIYHCLAKKDIADLVSKGMYNAGFISVQPNLITSWNNSLPKIAEILKMSNVSLDVDVAVEYVLKHSHDRLDFLIYGKDNNDSKNVIIVELKQWSQVQNTSSLNNVYTMVAKGLFENHPHPSYQALNYAGQLKFFNEYVQKENVGVEACSYCHNMDNAYKTIMENIALFPFVASSPSFLAGDDEKEKLRDFINKYVNKRCHEILYEINMARTIPSDDFAKLIREALHGNQMYSLDENQQRALTTIVDSVREARFYNQKKTIIIKGGAGTGKSIIAINALGLLNGPKKKGERIATFYVTVNAAPKKTIYNKLTAKKEFAAGSISSLFKYPSFLINKPTNDIPCLLIDEAHRLFKWKYGVGIPKGINVLKEIINTAQIAVFFIDDNQAVTVDDYATIDLIKQYAKECRSQVLMGPELELTGQYRVQGGYNYISFIKSFLEIDKDIVCLQPDSSYDFRVFDSPNEMYDLIKELDTNSRIEQAKKDGNLALDLSNYSGNARLVAGYTYEWVSNQATRDGINDVVIPKHDFGIKWNLRYGSGLKAYSWADDPLSISEAGCIHTCQGIDLDYCGVIIGKDIFYKDGRIQFDKTQHATTDFAGIRTASDEIAEMLIKNTYYVLLTRGIRGTFVYCEDESLNKYLKSLVSLKNEV